MIGSAGSEKTTLCCVLRWLLMICSAGPGKTTSCCILR